MAANDSDKVQLWRLPIIQLKEVGKVGPTFGLGVRCSVGFGLGLVGGVGIGPEVPGLKLGFGAGCGLRYEFGYRSRRGVGHDDLCRYSNVGNLFKGPRNLPTKDEISDVHSADDLRLYLKASMISLKSEGVLTWKPRKRRAPNMKRRDSK